MAGITKAEFNRRRAAEARARHALAKSIASELFTNGLNECATRLVLELPGGKDGGGWCLGAAIDRIERVLTLAAAGNLG